MRARELAEVISMARSGPSGFTGLCPAHDDQRASLSWRDGEEALLIWCHAGCDVQAIAAALGLRLSDLLHDGHSESVPTKRIVATYPYRDEFGNLLYEVVRSEPKDFRQRRPDGIGGWIWNLSGVRRVLYRLPDLKGHSTVYVVEGEKDADRLTALGIPATSNAGGASKWNSDLASQLQWAGIEHVVILPDNDEAGKKHAEMVARSCLAVGLGVRIVTLPGLPPKGDVSDWLAAGHTKEELLELAAVAPPRTTAADTHLPYGPVLTRLSDVAGEDVSWLWPGRLARGKLTLLAGDPGLGKSFLTLDVV